MNDFCDNAGAENTADQQARKGDAMREVLEHHFIETLSLPKDAVAWLLGLWDAIQFMDDVADEDEISRDQFDNALYQMLVAMPGNPFFMSRANALLPVMMTAMLKWQTSDMLETVGEVDARTYMWRAGYYDVVLLVVQLCHGYDAALDLGPFVLKLYGEKLEDYQREFCDA
jgi:hypothetical protein